MIELIFVIIIIGILAGVAIPKLASNRDDAVAATCMNDLGVLISEFSNKYPSIGYSNFITTTIGNFTNMDIYDKNKKPTIAQAKNGILAFNETSIIDLNKSTAPTGTTIDPSDKNNGIRYMCESSVIAAIYGDRNSTADTYQLHIVDVEDATTTLASEKARKLMRNNYNIADPDANGKGLKKQRIWSF